LQCLCQKIACSRIEVVGGLIDGQYMRFKPEGHGNLGSFALTKAQGIPAFNPIITNGQTPLYFKGDAVIGLPHPEVIQLFQQDPETKAIVMFGEIGGSQEERVADLIESGEVTKPVIAYIGGKAAKSGTRFSHAGAIIEGGRGTHEGKVERLLSVGATVVDAFGDLPAATKEVLARLGL